MSEFEKEGSLETKEEPIEEEQKELNTLEVELQKKRRRQIIFIAIGIAIFILIALIIFSVIYFTEDKIIPLNLTTNETDVITNDSFIIPDVNRTNQTSPGINRTQNTTTTGGGSGGGGGSVDGSSGETNTSTCTNDTGCTYVGNFCDSNLIYNCTLGSDGCLDKVNGATCGSGEICDRGECIEVYAIFVDNQLTNDCLTGSYSIANRNCNGGDGIAFNTIQEGADNATAGTTVYIRGGNYNLTTPVSMNGKIGTSAGKISISGFQNEQVVIDGSTITPRDFSSLNSLVYVHNSSFITFQKISFKNSINYTNGAYGGSGLYLFRSNNVSVFYSKFEHLKGHGVFLFGTSNSSVEYNEILDCSLGIGIAGYVSGTPPYTNATFNLIRNNLVYNNTLNPEGSDGIAMSGSANNNSVISNVLYGNYDDGIDSSCGGGDTIGSNYNKIENNLAFNNGDGQEITNTSAPGYWVACILGAGYCAYNSTLNLCHYGCGDGNGIKVSTNAGGGHFVAGNIVFDNERAGFDQDKALGFPQNFFHSNTAYKNSAGGLLMDAPSLPQNEDALVYNNLAFNNSVMDLRRSNDLAVNDSDYNLWGDGNFVSGMDVHSLSGNPLFNNSNLAIDTNFNPSWTIVQKLDSIRNQVRAKLSLQAGSPAIDKGTFIPGYHCSTSGAHSGEDCHEWYGSAPDIGAYEHP